MAVNIIISALLAVLAVSLYKIVIHPAFLSPLAAIPAGRWHARFSPLWSLYIRWANIENRTFYQLHQKHGPIVLVGPAELSVNCYEGGLKTIYTGGFLKTDFYAKRFTNYGHGPLFTMMNSKDHSERKRIMTHIYSKTSIMSSPTVRATSHVMLFERLLPLLQVSSDSSIPIDFYRLNYAYSMDSFTAFQFGLSLGSNMIQDGEELDSYLHHFFIGRPYQFWTTELPNLTNFLLKFGIRVRPKCLAASTASLENWNLDKCDAAERLSSQGALSPSDPLNWPAVFAAQLENFRAADARAGHVHDKTKQQQAYPRRLEIASDMYDQNAAAIETSGNTLTWLHYEMARRPVLQAELREELLAGCHPPVVFPTGAEPEGEPRLPSSKDLDGLPLLDAILQETLRLWTAVPGGQPRVTPPGGCMLAGRTNIPGGVRVQAAAYSLHRNAEVFPEPEEWRPERWLEASPAELAEMRHWFWAWGSGGMMCIGSHFAVQCMFHPEIKPMFDVETSSGKGDGNVLTGLSYETFHCWNLHQLHDQYRPCGWDRAGGRLSWRPEGQEAVAEGATCLRPANFDRVLKKAFGRRNKVGGLTRLS